MEINTKDKQTKENYKENKSIIIITTAIATFIITALLSIICFFCLKPKMAIVFYDIENVQEEIIPDYSEEYVCAYFRLNSKNNLILDVKNFSIRENGIWKKAFQVEYFDQIIKTTFQTYPNQPILKVFFNVNYSNIEPVAFVKYKDTQMRIGELAYTK